MKSYTAFLVGIVATRRQNASQRHVNDGVFSSSLQSVHMKHVSIEGKETPLLLLILSFSSV